MLKGIIFDFDGVIADSIQVKTNAFAELFSPSGLNIVNKIIRHHEANGGLSRFEKIRYYYQVFLKKSITDEKVNEIAKQFSSIVVEKVISAPYIPGVLEYIQNCESQYKLFISTGTPTDEIIQILEEKKISKYFTGVFGSPDKKTQHIQSIISKYKIASDELLFYGDSTIDLDAAKAENIRFILIRNENNRNIKLESGAVINNFFELF